MRNVEQGMSNVQCRSGGGRDGPRRPPSVRYSTFSVRHSIFSSSSKRRPGGARVGEQKLINPCGEQARSRVRRSSGYTARAAGRMGANEVPSRDPSRQGDGSLVSSSPEASGLLDRRLLALLGLRAKPALWANGWQGWPTDGQRSVVTERPRSVCAPHLL